MNERSDRRYHPSDRRLVYSQHWLLFTGSRGHKTPIQQVVKSWWHQSRELCVQAKHTVSPGVRSEHWNVQSKFICFLCSSRDWNADNMKRSAAQTSKQLLFCHLHCGIYIKRSTFRYLLTSFWLKVRVFPYLGRAWVERGKKINDIIALTTLFSYLNWQHQLKLFHGFLQWYIWGACLGKRFRSENSLQLPLNSATCQGASKPWHHQSTPRVYFPQRPVCALIPGWLREKRRVEMRRPIPSLALFQVSRQTMFVYSFMFYFEMVLSPEVSAKAEPVGSVEAAAACCFFQRLTRLRSRLTGWLALWCWMMIFDRGL